MNHDSISRGGVEEAVDALAPALVDLSRSLHRDPELSGEEHRASGRIQRLLAGAGFAIEAPVAGLPTAFVARRRLGPDGGAGLAGPRIAFLAEYDALPGIGHACGHNLIAAAGAGAGLAVLQAAGGLEGEILVIGTPAEETIGGKCVMVREGIFEGIDAALMIHPGSEWRVDVDSLACVSLEVTYLGREAHAVAWPEKGVNALDALVQLYVGTDMLRKRLGRDVKIPGIITEGGVRANIIPARATGRFSLRAPDSAARDRVRVEFEKLAEGIAVATGCAVTVRATDEPYDDMLTNAAMAAVFKRHLSAEGIATVDGPRPQKGSLDMGNVSRVVPSIHPFIAICDPSIPSHSAPFAEATVGARGEAALLTAVRALALTALDLLAMPELMARARREFEQAAAGRRA